MDSDGALPLEEFLASRWDFESPWRNPWDAEFHEWCEKHPDPLEGLDLSHVSKILHDIVILRQLPTWFPEPPPLYRETT
jgi:hypothetical protein